MMRCKQIPLRLLFLLLFAANQVLADCCPEDELYAIKPTGSYGLLALDGSQPPQVLIKTYTGSSSQLWQIKRGSIAGLYYIINNHTGDALDFFLDPVGKDRLVPAMSKQKDTHRQQWSLNTKGRIKNAAVLKNLDVWLSDFKSGTRVILENDFTADNIAQEFDLHLTGARPNVDGC